MTGKKGQWTIQEFRTLQNAIFATIQIALVQYTLTSLITISSLEQTAVRIPTPPKSNQTLFYRFFYNQIVVCHNFHVFCSSLFPILIQKHTMWRRRAMNIFNYTFNSGNYDPINLVYLWWNLRQFGWFLGNV